MARKVKRGEYTIVEPSYSMSYTLDPANAPIKRHPLTSQTEIRDILAALAVLTIAFYWLLNPGGGRDIPYHVGLAALSVFAGFLLHEMSHKFVARRYGCWAEFRADYRMLLLALVISFFGFLFAAPGAVMIAGYVDAKRNGRISLAGPGANLLVGVTFLGLLIFTSSSGFVHSALTGLSVFSIYLAGFNMIPLMPFDGAKIWRWSKPIYILVLLSAGLLFYLAYTF